MSIDLSYPEILMLLEEHLDPGRTESASFLVWYLEKYYRLEASEAVDCVCDQRGDRGVDGIYVNEDSGTIDVFQTKIHQSPGRTIGDSSLREFRGTLCQFESQEALQNLVKTAGRAEVARLVERLALVERLPNYVLRGIFLANAELDANGEAFFSTESTLEFIGRGELEKTFISDSRDVPRVAPADFDVSGIPVSEYVVDTRTRALIAPVRARELVRLQGIEDQSVFSFNVRGPLGRTGVNRDIEKSIRDPATHKRFPLFHNGITIIAAKVTNDAENIRIDQYHVVNGCQSLTALFKNRKHITEDLRILAKILEMDIDSSLPEEVTRFSNNQNGVKPRDFKSNDPIQIRLQNEFKSCYPGTFSFGIKRGEVSGTGQPISNESAGLDLMAFDLREPWATHRKYQVFDDKYTALFARPEVTAHRIVLLHVLSTTVASKTVDLENSLFGKYALTRYAVLYMLRLVLQDDDAGQALLLDPREAVNSEELRDGLRRAIESIVDDMIVDINHEVKEYGEDFDYRGRLRDADWVRALARTVVGSYQKLVKRGRIESLEMALERVGK